MTQHSNKREIESASSLSQRLGLSFSNASLLTRALTHRSYANEHPESMEDNERLEFLGDAVLDFIVGEWAYHRFPEKPEGDLTKIRANIVKNEKLADFSRRLELASALRLGRGEQSSGGHERDNLLGSAFEALIGAIYLDAGLDEVRRFVNPLLEWKRPTILDEIEDPKSELQELTQSQKRGTPHYVVVNTSGPDHAKVFEVEVHIKDEVVAQGTGTSKSAAQHDAARKALKKLT